MASIAMEADVQTELRPTKRGYDRFDDNGKSQLPMRYVYIAVGIVVVLLALVIIAAGIAVGVIFGTRGCGSQLDCLASTVRSNMNTSANPCDNFYQFSCGGWDNQYTTTASFLQLNRVNDQNVAAFVDLIESGKDSNVAAVRLAKKFYDLCMDTARLDALGAQPLLDLVNSTGGWSVINVINKTAPSWQFNSPDFIESHELGNPAFFKLEILANDTNSNQQIASLDQSGLTLPLDFYKLPQIATVLQTQINTTLNMFGGRAEDKRKAISDIVAIEVDLANISRSTDVRSPYAKYNPTTLQELSQKFPKYDLVSYFIARFARAGVTVSGSLPINLRAKGYFDNIQTVLDKYNSTQLENYFKWQLVHTYRPYLGTDHLQAFQKLRQMTEGVALDNSRATACIGSLQTVVPYTLARLYAKYGLPSDTVPQLKTVAAAIKKAFNERLQNNTWIDAQTRAASMDKVNAISENYAYPQFVYNETELLLRSKAINNSDGTYFGIFKSWKSQNSLSQLNKPVDRNQWLSSPVQVNAFYYSQLNKFEFEEGILNSPFFSPGWPFYFQFGAMGSVVGHELTHGFDDQGHNYDKNGNLIKWWTDASLDAFNSRAQCFVDQYSNYTLQGIKMNGLKTLGENIADNGGLKTSYRAFMDTIGNTTQMSLTSINLTPQQLFFVAYSQVWCSIYTPAGLTSTTLADNHSPGPIRVLGALSNNEEFAKAFNCPAGSTYNPVKKCQLW